MDTPTKPSAVGGGTVAFKPRTVAPQVKALQFGVIGYGYWGPQLVRNLNLLYGSSVKFIADLDEAQLARAQSLYRRTRLTRNATDVFESDIDAVVISTPVHTRYPLARAALLANKHVFVEKPLAIKVSEVEELIQLAHERKRVLMVGYTFLYRKAVQELRRIITGQLEKLYYIDTQRLSVGLWKAAGEGNETRNQAGRSPAAISNDL
jgi:predicted dehydrogenase